MLPLTMLANFASLNPGPMKSIYITLLICIPFVIFGQDHACLTPAENEAIEAFLRDQVQLMKQNGQLAAASRNRIPLSLPLRNAPGFDFPGFFHIYNYVDHDPALGRVSDYQCGGRTYDGHRGTDYFAYPFMWQAMEQDQIWITAAAPGTIIRKINGNFDQECFFDFSFNGSRQWNAVYLRHDDGTIGWYGHLKNNSLTEKAVGDHVDAGEYLGVIGSSGYSSGPHLHFQYYADDALNQLLDPYQGECNSTLETSAWANQAPYSQERINQITVHTGPIRQTFTCPVADAESRNQQYDFTAGAEVLIAVHGSDAFSGSVMTRVYDPFGEVVFSWSARLPSTQSVFSITRELTLPADAPTGTWTIKAQLADGPEVSRTFQLLQFVENAALAFRGFAVPNGNRLQWQTPTGLGNIDHYDIYRATTGEPFSLLSSLTTPANQLSVWLDETIGASQPARYRLEFMDSNGEDYRSEEIFINRTTLANEIVLAGNPWTANSLLYNFSPTEIDYLLYNNQGQIIIQGQLPARGQSPLAIADLPAGLYIISWQVGGQRKAIKLLKQP